MSIMFGLFVFLLLGLIVAVVTADQIHRRGDCETCRRAGVLIRKAQP